MGVRFAGRFPAGDRAPQPAVVPVRDGRAAARGSDGTTVLVGHVHAVTYDGDHCDVAGIISHPAVSAELAAGALPARLDHADGRVAALLLIDPGLTAGTCMITAWAPAEPTPPTTP